MVTPKKGLFSLERELIEKVVGWSGWQGPDIYCIVFPSWEFLFCWSADEISKNWFTGFLPDGYQRKQPCMNHSYNLQINDLSNAMIYTLGQNVSTRGQKLRFAPVWWLYGLMNGFGFPLSFPIYQEIEFLARFLLNFLLSGNVTVSDVWFSP